MFATNNDLLSDTTETAVLMKEGVPCEGTDVPSRLWREEELKKMEVAREDERIICPESGQFKQEGRERARYRRQPS